VKGPQGTLCVFVAAYLLLAACVVALWWFAPTVFLLGFFTVSAFHFSGDLDAQAHFPTRFLYGGAPLVLPVGLHAAELDRLLGLLTDSHAAGSVVALLHGLVWPWVLGLGAAVIYSVRRDALLALEVMAVSVVSFTASPLLGFTVFFCVMHSPRHILRTQKMANMAPKGLIAVAALPMLAVVMLGAGGWYVLPDSAFDQRVLQFVFVSLAALTVPHMVLVERVRLGYWKSKDASTLQSVSSF